MKSKDIGTLISVLILIATVATLFFYRTKIIEKITELKGDILPDRREKEKETKPEPQTETGKAPIQLQNLPEIIQPQFVTQPIVADVPARPTSFTQTETHPDLVSTKTTKIFIKGTGSGSTTSSKKATTPPPKVQKAESKSG